MNIFARSAKKLLTQICTIVYNNPRREIYVLGSSSGLGHRPLTAGTGVRLPYRVPKSSQFGSFFLMLLVAGMEGAGGRDRGTFYKSVIQYMGIDKTQKGAR